MTRQEARALLPVIEAWANGEEIQVGCVTGNQEWMNVCDNAMFGPECLWRIKPKCREFWVVVTRGSGEIACTLPTKPGPREFDPCLYNIWHCHGEVVS